ncbi:hypothetical protein Vafri_20335 [Volvox africanus]|uniref:Uncharacterized protein n=1 Tax=Volvox africanus TaxID=51714 RepID=A0A8J4BPW8_9CHLO|nr:hypothetical protein Vafri_20335 [Volvox africanus]
MALAAAVARGLEVTAPSTSGACSLERFLNAAAETHVSIGRRPAREMHSPVTLLINVAEAAQRREEQIKQLEVNEPSLYSIPAAFKRMPTAPAVAAAATRHRSALRPFMSPFTTSNRSSRH